MSRVCVFKSVESTYSQPCTGGGALIMSRALFQTLGGYVLVPAFLSSSCEGSILPILILISQYVLYFKGGTRGLSPA